MANTLPNFIPAHERMPVTALEFEDPEELKIPLDLPIDIDQRTPLLSTEAVAAQVGAPIGELMAVVQLPVRETQVAGRAPVHDISTGNWGRRFGESLKATVEERQSREGAAKVYCFRAASVGKHGRDTNRYFLMGGNQIEQLRSASAQGANEMSDITGGVLSLRQGQKAPIGRDGWLPNVGWDYQLLKNEDPWLRVAFESVSHKQATAEVNAEGHLLLARSPNSFIRNANDMLLSVGEQLPTYSHTRDLGRAGLGAV
jgi:hypothetical protein